MRNDVTVYELFCERCRVVIDDAEEVRRLNARWLIPGQDDAKARTEAIEGVARKAQAVDLRRDGVSIDVLSVSSARFAGENEVRLGPVEKPVPDGRARVRLDFADFGHDDLDRLFEFEDRLDRDLQEAGVGYVEGNDYGGGEFRLFCQGPRKRPLREAVERIASAEALPPWKIARSVFK